MKLIYIIGPLAILIWASPTLWAIYSIVKDRMDEYMDKLEGESYYILSDFTYLKFNEPVLYHNITTSGYMKDYIPYKDIVIKRSQVRTLVIL